MTAPDAPEPRATRGAPDERNGALNDARARLVAALACTCTLAAGVQPAQAKLTPQTLAFWDRIAQCETGGNWQMRGSRYEGGVGFAVSTWQLWAGQIRIGKITILDRFPHAYLAPRHVQVWVAEWGHRRGGYWGCDR